MAQGSSGFLIGGTKNTSITRHHFFSVAVMEVESLQIQTCEDMRIQTGMFPFGKTELAVPPRSTTVQDRQ